MLVRENQVTPMHFHYLKVEDIINRGGGNLVLRHYGSNEDENLSEAKHFAVYLSKSLVTAACKISGQTEPENAVRDFIDKGVGTVLVTQGPDPVLVFSNGSLFDAMQLAYLPVSRNLSAEMLSGDHPKKDTTGCGDNFAGGLLADLAIQLQSKDVGHLDLSQACAWGICSGGIAGTYPGGVYMENRLGEKYRRIKSFVDQYRRQIDGLGGKRNYRP
jgi:hypothetical protein